MKERSSRDGVILLVEDNPGDVRLLQEALAESDIDHTLYVATDGDEALDYLYQRGEYTGVSCPDIVLLDLNLPQTNGFEVLETISDDPELSLLPVLVVTGSTAEEDIVRCYDLSANAYLTKPYNLHEFNSLVQSIERFWFEAVRFPPISA